MGVTCTCCGQSLRGTPRIRSRSTGNYFCANLAGCEARVAKARRLATLTAAREDASEPATAA